MRRVLYMMWKEVIELRQDPRIFSIIFIAPILQLTILGYAATTDVRNVPVVIVDADRSAASQALISRFGAVSTFTIVDVVSSIDEVDPYLESGRAWMALAIPPRYSENLANSRSTTLQIVADGSDASLAGGRRIGLWTIEKLPRESPDSFARSAAHPWDTHTRASAKG